MSERNQEVELVQRSLIPEQYSPCFSHQKNGNERIKFTSFISISVSLLVMFKTSRIVTKRINNHSLTSTFHAGKIRKRKTHSLEISITGFTSH